MKMISEEESSKGMENSAQSSLSSERKVFFFFFFGQCKTTDTRAYMPKDSSVIQQSMGKTMIHNIMKKHLTDTRGQEKQALLL